MLIHAMHLWLEVAKQYLWPCVIYLAADIRNKHKLNRQGTTPIKKLTRLSQPFGIKNNHAFGYPDYVLDASLQDKKSIPRLDERIRVGAYLGRLKQHA